MSAFAYEALHVSGAGPAAFVAGYSLVPFDLTHGVQPIAPAPPEALTLLSFQFLHGSILHLTGNMLVLATFGPEVEALMGHLRFVSFYLACGVVGGLAQVAASPQSHVPSLGASGAIAGVLGAYALHFPLRPLVWRIPALLVIGLWAVSQFVHGFGPSLAQTASAQAGPVAYFAHIGGFVAGVLLSGFFR